MEEHNNVVTQIAANNATPSVATAVVVANKAVSSTGLTSGPSHGRWVFRGRPASVTGVIAWPAGLPVLHPSQTLRLLEDRVKKRTIKNFVHSYDKCFTGEDVIQYLVKDRYVLKRRRKYLH